MGWVCCQGLGGQPVARKVGGERRGPLHRACLPVPCWAVTHSLGGPMGLELGQADPVPTLALPCQQGMHSPWLNFLIHDAPQPQPELS